MIRRLLRRLRPNDGPRAAAMLPAQTIVDRWRADGSTPDAALVRTLEQVEGLSALVADDAGWARITRMLVRSGGDSWLAHDWPAGFEPLMLCAPLCRLVDYECARCSIGREQDARSCVNPTSAFGTVGFLLAEGDRAAVADYLEQLKRRLAGMVEPNRT